MTFYQSFSEYQFLRSCIRRAERDNLIVSRGYSNPEAFVLQYYIPDLKDNVVLALKNNLVCMHVCTMFTTCGNYRNTLGIIPFELLLYSLF